MSNGNNMQHCMHSAAGNGSMNEGACIFGILPSRHMDLSCRFLESCNLERPCPEMISVTACTLLTTAPRAVLPTFMIYHAHLMAKLAMSMPCACMGSNCSHAVSILNPCSRCKLPASPKQDAMNSQHKETCFHPFTLLLSTKGAPNGRA